MLSAAPLKTGTHKLSLNGNGRASNHAPDNAPKIATGHRTKSRAQSAEMAAKQALPSNVLAGFFPHGRFPHFCPPNAASVSPKTKNPRAGRTIRLLVKITMVSQHPKSVQKIPEGMRISFSRW